MAQITVKFDHSLEIPSIVMPLIAPADDEAKSRSMKGFIEQTSIYGTIVPLVKIGDIVVEQQDIHEMELYYNNHIPEITLTVTDSHHLMEAFQNPTSDSHMCIQILPRFENAYKKINLMFYITDCKKDDSNYTFTGLYKIPELHNSQVKCFGQVTTYEFFEQIAKDCKLGFASNLESTDDKRYHYCRYTSYLDEMERSIGTSGPAGNDIQSKVMYDFWVDFWNNVNLVDVYERYNSVDPDNELEIYISASENDPTQGNKDKENYIKTTALISNNPARQGSELFIDHYDVKNNSTQGEKGSDRVFSTYSMADGTADDFLLQDGDQKKDLFAKYYYSGECYSEFNYILAKECREMMDDKMNEEVIEVSLHSPVLSLMRGGKVNLHWYDIGADVGDKKDTLGLDDSAMTTNIPIPEEETIKNEDGPVYRINKMISGQYYILDCIIRYEDNGWWNILKLVRPRDTKQNYIDLEEATKNIK